MLAPDARAQCSQVLIYSEEGEQLQAYRPYENALGIKTVAWHPHGHLLAIGSYDQRARLLNSLTWQRLAECEHPSELRPSFSEDAVVWTEPSADAHPSAGYSASRLPLSIPEVKPNSDRPNPKIGVGLLAWSAGGKFLATRNDNLPRALWVWSADELTLHSILLQSSAVRAAAWHPTRQLLALCSDESKLYMWSASGCRTAPLPVSHGFRVTSIEWSSRGDALLLLDKDRFCISFVPLPPADANEGNADLAVASAGDEASL